MIQTEMLIIGSGIAGLSLALKASKFCKVSIITKKEISDTATQKAQGGIACVVDKSDSFDSHIKDTLSAGAGLCNEKAVRDMVYQAPERIKELIELGVNFTKSQTTHCGYELGLEGAHSNRRIFHAGDMTGKEIQQVLAQQVLENKNIDIYQYHTAIDLILDEQNICRGAFVLDNKNAKVETFLSKATVIAGGGTGKTYLYTTNPDIATGDGVAMAYRAGADISNMEFIQFHPTCFYNKIEKSFLISEAVRGEGAVLRLQNGEPFMQKYHPLKELAPRDIVSRAIDVELKNSGDEFVYLDISSKKKDFITKHFPGIYAKCLQYNIDITKDMIPVVPAAHFLCGGIKIDEHGRTSIENLFAIGESACSGVHGANRLASNSLLEGCVYASNVSQYCKDIASKEFVKFEPSFKYERNTNKSDVDFVKNWKTIRNLSWQNLGITRNNKDLAFALDKIREIKKTIDKNFTLSSLTTDSIEMRNIICIAELIALCAISRKESRGAHFNTDYPKLLPDAKDTIINNRHEK
ncbi:MAG: L-aspartate oxidase [Elusimicrobiota bacterium]|jgi:L-aspartate oxidase|nr:L-aspartate oxidase [Elusimicrobiota bacterium]